MSGNSFQDLANSFQNLVERFKAKYGGAQRVAIDSSDGDLANFVAAKIAVHALGRERVVILHHREHPEHPPSIMEEWGMRQGADGAPIFMDLSGLLSQISRPSSPYDLVGSDRFLRLDPILWGKTPKAVELWNDAVAIVTKRMGAVVVPSRTADDVVHYQETSQYGPTPSPLYELKSGEVAQLALHLGYSSASYMRRVKGELRSTRWDVVSPAPDDQMQTVIRSYGGMEYVSMGFYEAVANIIRATYGYNMPVMDRDKQRYILRFLVLGEGEDMLGMDEKAVALRASIKDIQDKTALFTCACAISALRKS